MSLDWLGDDVKKHIAVAACKGIDAIMARCVRTGKQLVRKKTTTLQGSIRIQQPAKTVGTTQVGIWGSVAVDYAIYQELGTWKMKAQPYLRPSADQHYPALAGVIQGFVE